MARTNQKTVVQTEAPSTDDITVDLSKVEAQVEEQVKAEEPTETKVEEPATQTQPQRGLPKIVVKPTEEELVALAKMTSMSAKIRFLAGRGYSSKDNLYSGIANYLTETSGKLIRTQQVRNVLTQPLKKA